MKWAGVCKVVTKIVFFASLWAVILLVSCSDPSGETPSDGSFQIASPADMAKIGTELPLDGKYILVADITLTGWKGIGDSAAPFTGVFNGNNKTITITGERGLFGRTKGSSIRNVTISGTINRPAGNDEFVGSIAGYAENTRIDSCTSTANITLGASGHNASAGGIVGFMRGASAVSDCKVSGTITLQSDKTAGWMVYAGGIIGYSGSGQLWGDGSNDGCTVIKCRWDGKVIAEGSYSYGGGVVGYNFSATVRESSATGELIVNGGNLPYAGGIAGYNSAYPSLIENCYAAVTVYAESQSKSALAGGIAGANANRARISKCYAAGSVTAQVVGNSSKGTGGTIGVPVAANIGGIAGAQYHGDYPLIEYCAALNSQLEGKDSGSGAMWNIFRIAGKGDNSSDTGKWENNIAKAEMTILPAAARNDDKGPDNKNGNDAAAKPEQSVYAALGWDFTAIWNMQGDHPVLK